MKASAFGPALFFALASASNRRDVVITRPFIATLLSEGILAAARRSIPIAARLIWERM
jgi:hypothetical protein